MKKDRNCGMGYPVYPGMMPNYGGMMMPGQVIPMPNSGMFSNVPLASVQSNINSNDLSELSNQVNNLESRVSRLENMVKNNYGNYNASNYQMM